MSFLHPARNWCATLYNCTADELTTLITGHVEQATYQEELCPTTGRKHIQAVFKFGRKLRFSQVKQLLDKYNPHIELCRNYAKSVEYCSKAESKIGPTISIDKPNSNFETIRTLIDKGDIETIRSEHFGLYLRHRRAILEDMVGRAIGTESPHLRGIWIYGPAGCGKTTTAAKCSRDIYWKAPNKWWDGYRGENIVLLDDVDKKMWTWATHFIKRWTDHYCITGETKGGHIHINHSWFIITSNESIEQSTCELSIYHQQAIQRRFIQLQFGKDDIKKELEKLITASSLLGSKPPVEGS